MKASQLPSFRRQNLLLEYASLKYIKLRSIYVSLTPSDPTAWAGVLFVRKGIYAPAILRFRIHFPSDYPYVPPIVTFNTDIFHPLVTPLTTYTYTGPPQGNDGTNNGDVREQLPPGALSLRCGFPFWYEQGQSTSIARQGAGEGVAEGDDETSKHRGIEAEGPEDVTVAEILRYVRTAFEDADMLDAVPFDVAANPGAWYAWQSYRGRDTKTVSLKVGEKVDVKDGSGTSTPSRPKGPSEWNWEGVWEERVKRVVQNSLSEASLYGRSGVGDDEVRFAKLGEEELKEVRTLMEAAERDSINNAS